MRKTGVERPFKVENGLKPSNENSKQTYQRGKWIQTVKLRKLEANIAALVLLFLMQIQVTNLSLTLERIKINASAANMHFFFTTVNLTSQCLQFNF